MTLTKEARPGIARRFFAVRGSCLFVDRVNGREVWEWDPGDGTSWMGQGRFGLWVLRG